MRTKLNLLFPSVNKLYLIKDLIEIESIYTPISLSGVRRVEKDGSSGRAFVTKGCNLTGQS